MRRRDVRAWKSGTYLSTGHDTGQIIIRFERRFMGFPDNSERRGKTPKSTNGKFGCSGNTVRQFVTGERWHGWTYNCRKARRSSTV